MRLWIGLAGLIVTLAIAVPPRVWRLDKKAAHWRGSAAEAITGSSLVPLAEHAPVANRSILIRTPLLTDRREIGFAPIMAAAFRSAPGGPSELTAQWLPADLPGGLGGRFVNWTNLCKAKPARCLATPPFRLLAVSLRPDLAHFRLGSASTEDGVVRGVEVRFDYVLANTPGGVQVDVGQAFVIVEFVLAPMPKTDFLSLLRRWLDYSKLPDADYPETVLADLFQKVLPKMGTARLRMMSNTANGGSLWKLREFRFGDKGLILSNLDGEIREGGWRVSNCELTPEAKQFVQHFSPENDRIELPPNLSEKDGQIRGNSALSIGRNQPDPERKRFLLALNRCRECHSAELTKTSISHLHFREPGGESKISPFLSGAEQYGLQPSTGAVRIPLNPGCGAPAEINSFNDLLRRHLFLRKALTLSASANDWTAQLSPYRVLEVH